MASNKTYQVCVAMTSEKRKKLEEEKKQKHEQEQQRLYELQFHPCSYVEKDGGKKNRCGVSTKNMYCDTHMCRCGKAKSSKHKTCNMCDFINYLIDNRTTGENICIICKVNYGGLVNAEYIEYLDDAFGSNVRLCASCKIINDAMLRRCDDIFTCLRDEQGDRYNVRYGKRTFNLFQSEYEIGLERVYTS